MQASTWALLFFTVLGQLSVGSFVLLGLVNLGITRRFNSTVADSIANRCLWGIGGFLILGFIASVFHLGQPLRAINAINGFATSWLSREIVLGVAFAALGFLFTIMQWRQWGTAGLRRLLAILAAIVGLGLVYAMSQVYTVVAQPGWDTWTTPALFFATTLLLGTVGLAATAVGSYHYAEKRGVPGVNEQQALATIIQWLTTTAIVAVGIEFVFVILNAIHLMTVEPGYELLAGSNGFIFISRLILVFVGAVILGLFILRWIGKPESRIAVQSLVYIAFLLVLIAELMGRYIFYTNQVVAGLAQ